MIDIVNELKEYGIDPLIADPIADVEEAKREYGIEFTDLKDVRDVNAVILAVAHDVFLNLTESDIAAMYQEGEKKVLLDIKGLLNRKNYEEAGYRYWRL